VGAKCVEVFLFFGHLQKNVFCEGKKERNEKKKKRRRKTGKQNLRKGRKAETKTKKQICESQNV
jgi:hypothetical protein